MRIQYLICIIGVTVFLSCYQRDLKYELYSNGKLAFTIFPKDIEFYDTTQRRGYIEIHELRLKKDFFKSDSLLLVYPIELFCKIGKEQYFWSDFFHKTQSQPKLWINFHFRSSCENLWNFPERGKMRLSYGDTLVFHTNNDCNSIEFFHSRNEIERSRKTYYEKKEYFQNYVDTARLAHEILLDPNYLGALKAKGVPIK